MENFATCVHHHVFQRFLLKIEMLEHIMVIEINFSTIFIALFLGLGPLKRFTYSASNQSTPFKPAKKSKCQYSRRNSPSVIDFKPSSICFWTSFSISSFSMAVSYFGRFHHFGSFPSPFTP